MQIRTLMFMGFPSYLGLCCSPAQSNLRLFCSSLNTRWDIFHPDQVIEGSGFQRCTLTPLLFAPSDKAADTLIQVIHRSSLLEWCICFCSIGNTLVHPAMWNWCVHLSPLWECASVCRCAFSPPQCASSWLTKHSTEKGPTSIPLYPSIHPPAPPTHLCQLGLLRGRALWRADLSRMWPHKRAQSECNELSAHYTDLSTFDMSSGNQRWTHSRREGQEG